MATAKKQDVFQAIADPTRRKMLRLLADDEMPITGISEHFPMSRTAVSKHLRVLAEANLVSVEKIGREKRYKLQASALFELKQWLSFFEQFWDNKIAMLKYVVENEKTESIEELNKKN
ncbi:ArsR/SmtB family transcription factor [Halalkalibacter okhensis]|uniref:ArsR family transcriptional regulator n=1 Tax=Halalkalibacter okhensis TaxID=333138 RepID=A0A0B0IH18_9BACI|nr:metalloregulator ArsR/SmtB family transcription factor [Halalkalibacter okhensis]KHF40182.1 ArsR family transcriptional regulator [Halalkalibacter okhensis]